MGASSNPHASGIFATTTRTLEAITQIKKQRTCQIPEQRMEWWKQGKLELISVCEAIQTRLKKLFKTKEQSDQKAFCRLMLQVKKALRFVK